MAEFPSCVRDSPIFANSHYKDHMEHIAIMRGDVTNGVHIPVRGYFKCLRGCDWITMKQLPGPP